MEASQILTADVLDIIFEGRNKQYGAYELRKSYSRRMLIAMSTMFGLLALLYAWFLFAANSHAAETTKNILPTIIELKPPPAKEENLIPRPTKPPGQQKVKKLNFMVPLIVKDDLVKEDEKPPETKELDNARIGPINQVGFFEDNITAPPISDGKRITEAPKRDDAEDNKVFTRVEIESAYPGGAAAWTRYLIKTLRYPQEAQDNGIQGPVVVQFIVDKEGLVSDVEAISGPAELREEAVRVIKKSGKWSPAIQNGRQVKSYKKQPIGFRLDREN